MKFLVLQGHFCKDLAEFDFDPGDQTAVGEAPKCQACGRFIGALPLLPPIRGTLIAERYVFDLSASAENALISERCLRAFEENSIRGIDVLPIEFLAIEGPFDLATIGRFYWAETEWGAEIDPSRSGLRTRTGEFCLDCGYLGFIEGYDRVIIKESSWDGRDLFSVKGLPGVVLATERVETLCRKLKLEVCNFIPAEEYSQSWDKLG